LPESRASSSRFLVPNGLDRQRASYHPREIYERDEDLRDAINLIDSGLFSRGDTTTFRPLVESLLNADPFLVCADFRSYLECQDRIACEYRDPEQ